jgi:hypothetical protein
MGHYFNWYNKTAKVYLASWLWPAGLSDNLPKAQLFCYLPVIPVLLLASPATTSRRLDRPQLLGQRAGLGYYYLARMQGLFFLQKHDVTFLLRNRVVAHPLRYDVE